MPSKPPDKQTKSRAGARISLRVALFYTGFFTAAAYLLFFLTYLYTRHVTTVAETEVVEQRIDEYRITYLKMGSEALSERFTQQSTSSAHPENMFLRVRGPGVDLVAFSHPPTGEKIDRSRLAEIDITASGTAINLGEDKNSSWTIKSALLKQDTVIQVGRSNRQVAVVLRHFRRAFFYVLAPILLLGFFGGLFLNYQALHPIRKLAKVIESILRTGDLDKRVDDEFEGSEFHSICTSFDELLGRNQKLIGAMHEAVADLSHDLRTPLARLRAAMEEGASAKAGTSIALEACREGIEECDQVVSILRAILESAEAESGAAKLQSEEVAVEELIERAVSLFEFVAEDRNICFELELDSQLRVHADRIRLVRVLCNLLDNALKFSPDDTVIRVCAEKVTSGFIRIAITNQGPVIPHDEQHRVWARHYRSDASRSTEGLGLGLSYSKATVEAHGGTVDLISEPGEGTTFSLNIPSA